jgi:hypothetical protein
MPPLMYVVFSSPDYKRRLGLVPENLAQIINIHFLNLPRRQCVRVKLLVFGRFLQVWILRWLLWLFANSRTVRRAAVSARAE